MEVVNEGRIRKTRVSKSFIFWN